MFVLTCSAMPLFALAQNAPLLTTQSKELTLPASNIPVETSAEGTSGSTNAKNQVRFIYIKGSISRQLLANLKKENLDANTDPIPAGLIVLLDSKGGDGMAAIEIGRLLRKAKAHVFVTGECSSACVFVLAGGVVRGAPTFSIGIHQARITLSNDNAVISKEVDAKENQKAQALLDAYEREAPIYFAEMGIPSDLFMMMQSYPAKRLYRLSSPEITFYGLNGIEDDYLLERLKVYQDRPGRWPKDKDELHRRTLKVAIECNLQDKVPADFVRCYRRVLQDIY
jgi:ATP-dependent protease ClpP protease subunit